MSTHKCAVDWGSVSGHDLKADGFTDIDADCGGTGRGVIGHEEEAVNEIERWGLDRRGGFTGLQ